MLSKVLFLFFLGLYEREWTLWSCADPKQFLSHDNEGTDNKFGNALVVMAIKLSRRGDSVPVYRCGCPALLLKAKILSDAQKLISMQDRWLATECKVRRATYGPLLCERL